MDNQYSPDKQLEVPPVPIKTYQWEDLRREREIGAYPWTHLYKSELGSEITAEDIIRETTPRRDMSRDTSEDRPRSRRRGEDDLSQKILILDSSPGSSRKYTEDGEEPKVIIPNFSKEISIDGEEDNIQIAVEDYLQTQPTENENDAKGVLINKSKSVSPKVIFKRRFPDTQSLDKITSASKSAFSKTCQPMVNKIKHITETTLHKHDKRPNTNKVLVEAKKMKYDQQILKLKSSPGAERRKKFLGIKLGESDEMSKYKPDDSPEIHQRKAHIYEDIDNKNNEILDDSIISFSPETLGSLLEASIDDNDKQVLKKTVEFNETVSEIKSNASLDPSLTVDESDLYEDEHIMETLHNNDIMETLQNNNNKELQNEAIVSESDDNVRSEPDSESSKGSPNITITEIVDEVNQDEEEPSNADTKIEYGFSGQKGSQDGSKDSAQKDWSKINSDHEYEIIEKPPENITTIRDPHGFPFKIDTDHNNDERSSTVSLDRKSSDDNIINSYKIGNQECLDCGSSEDVEVQNAEALQQKIEDRFFLNTPSTTESRTECEISTSQVESSALENLPLKRENRTKHFEPVDTTKLQQKIREQTGKLKTQAGKLRLKLQNIKSKKMDTTEKKSGSDKSKLQLPKRPKINLPDRPKFNFPDRPKFSLPERRKFNLPERPKFKKISFPERKSKESSEPQKSKFTLPDLPKFKMPEMSKINFSGLSRQPKRNSQGNEQVETKKKLVDFEFQTFPRMFSKAKKQKTEQALSTPSLNRAGTPTPTFTFATVIATQKTDEKREDEYNDEEPRSYGTGFHRNSPFNDDQDSDRRDSPSNNNFGRIQADYDAESRQLHEIVETKSLNANNTSSYPNISLVESQSPHVINEINNDEFFVRQKGISHEDIEVRQYLSDEIRQAFKVPVNTLAQLETNSRCFDESNQSIDEDDPAITPEEPHDFGNETFIENDDGYYTFPPVRPSRSKQNKKQHIMPSYIGPSIDADSQQNDLCMIGGSIESMENEGIMPEQNEGFQQYENHSTEAETPKADLAPQPTKRRNKSGDATSGWVIDFYKNSNSNLRQWIDGQEDGDDVIVYRTEHEYTVADGTVDVVSDGNPIRPRRRNKSRSSRGTSLGDDDRTSHGAESLILDTHIATVESITELYPDVLDDSPDYAVVEKVSSSKQMPAHSRAPPFKPRKSHSSERKYYTVDGTTTDYTSPKYNKTCPSRPPRKKSSTSLMMLETLNSGGSSTDITQYVEIGDENSEEFHRDLKSGEVISKMKDRPLPPPPRPPRGPKKMKNCNELESSKRSASPMEFTASVCTNEQEVFDCDDVVEVEAFTQTDPLPDDTDCDLGIEVTYSEENADISNCLKNIHDDQEYYEKSHDKFFNSTLQSSSPSPRLDKSFTSDPKIAELSKSSIGRTSPVVILVERRVSSPTRINERDEILTEASLRVESITIPESQIPEVPPLPNASISRQKIETDVKYKSQEKSPFSHIPNPSTHELQVDNLVTQRLQVRDLDVGRLNVSELQASKILVSDLEGLSLQVAELDSKSSNIKVNGLEFAPSVIDEIVRKFAEINSAMKTQEQAQRPDSKEEETQTDVGISKIQSEEKYNNKKENKTESVALTQSTPEQMPNTIIPSQPVVTEPPQRPPPPDLSPLLYSYLQDLSVPPQSFFQLRAPRDKPFSDFYDYPSPLQPPPPPPPPARRTKRKPKVQSDSSSEDEIYPASKRVPVRAPEPSISELGAQFIRYCQNSVSRTIRSLMQSIMSYISGNENKSDMQMALVIFLVLLAGLIMFGLSDGRTVHHHHWEFFNPPDGK